MWIYVELHLKCLYVSQLYNCTHLPSTGSTDNSYRLDPMGCQSHILDGKVYSSHQGDIPTPSHIRMPLG